MAKLMAHNAKQPPTGIQTIIIALPALLVRSCIAVITIRATKVQFFLGKDHKPTGIHVGIQLAIVHHNHIVMYPTLVPAIIKVKLIRISRHHQPVKRGQILVLVGLPGGNILVISIITNIPLLLAGNHVGLDPADVNIHSAKQDCRTKRPGNCHLYNVYFPAVKFIFYTSNHKALPPKSLLL